MIRTCNPVSSTSRAGPAALRGLRELEIEGLTLGFSPTDNQGLDAVFLTKIDPDGNIVPMTGG